MQTLHTLRLILVQTPLSVLRTRLERDSFAAEVPIDGASVSVTFPAEWPGDALVLFPMMIAAMSESPDSLPWGGTIIERGTSIAIGQMGCKGFPDEKGTVEIGYGLNPSHWNRGYATEIVTAFAAWLLGQNAVTCVSAECSTDNIGSLRVLEKSGFISVGMRHDPEDGALMLWECR